MHEYSMTTQLVEVVLREARTRNSKGVVEVHLLMGRLTYLAPEQVRFWYEVLSEGTILEGSELYIEEEEGGVECESCGYKGPIKLEEERHYYIAVPTLRCPKCDSTVKIIRGKDCLVKSIKMVT